MENNNNSSEILLKALEDFKSQYPMSTSGDLQSFIIGWNKAVELLSLNNDNSSMDYTINNNTYDASGEKEYHPFYTINDEALFIKLKSELKIDYQSDSYVYYDKNGNSVIVENFETKIVYFSIKYFCSKFELYIYDKSDFKSFLNNMIINHLNCKGYKIELRETIY